MEAAVALCRHHVSLVGAAWAAIWVWGMACTPVSWNGNARAMIGQEGGGEDDYVILVLPQGRYHIFAACGAGVPDVFAQACAMRV